MDWAWLAGFLDWWTAPKVGATAAVVGATSAATAATSGVRTLRQNRRDSRSRSRPMMAAELRDHPYARATQLLVVKNYGPSIARNVTVTFDPEIPDPSDPSTSMTPFLKARYAKPIAVMTPGMELDNIYFSGERDTAEGWVNREPTPAQVTVTITYENDNRVPFADDFPLDTQIIRNRTYTTSSASPEALMKDAANALKDLSNIAKAAHGDWVHSRRAAADQAADKQEQAQLKAERHKALVRRVLPHKK
jgi:hypothetical protein